MKKLMKISMIVMLAVTLVACSPAPTQSPTLTASPQATLVPTLTPTTISISTFTPTATKDPKAPDEFTRFENGVYYMDLKTEKGNTLTYTWDKERNAWERVLFSGYMNDYPQEINNNGAHQTDQLLTTVYIDKSIEGEVSLPTLTHPDNVDPIGKVNFNVNFGTDYKRALVNRGIISGMTDATFAKWNEGRYHLDFTNADGPQRWDLKPGSTISIHIRGDYDGLQQNIVTNGFSEAKWNSSYGPKNSYMVKIWTENGNLLVNIAPSLRPATQWTEKQMLEMIFFGPANVMEKEDLTQPQSGSLLSEYVLNSKTLPYFTFGPPP